MYGGGSRFVTTCKAHLYGKWTDKLVDTPTLDVLAARDEGRIAGKVPQLRGYMCLVLLHSVRAVQQLKEAI